MRARAFGIVLLTLLGVGTSTGCDKKVDEPASARPTPVAIPGHDSLDQDTAPKESQRMVPPEAYLRTYLQIFGGMKPLEVQADAKKLINNKNVLLFDTWGDYLALLGLPDYASDIPRTTQTNALMLSTFERLGVTLCDRAIERDLKAVPPVPVADRRVFAFEVPQDAIDQAGFAERFDVLHRTFLGYPAALATTDRTAKFFALYQGAFTKYSADDAPASRLTPAEVGWASVCYGLIRHPEFHLY
ncbi:MAG TPA: hypothetical protein VK459_25370 [Polyangiaceae bacterium]|nr:hypothetical protein [Polyangiaceae bacterium]